MPDLAVGVECGPGRAVLGERFRRISNLPSEPVNVTVVPLCTGVPDCSMTLAITCAVPFAGSVVCTDREGNRQLCRGEQRDLVTGGRHDNGEKDEEPQRGT